MRGVPSADVGLHRHKVAAIEEAFERRDRARVPIHDTDDRVESRAAPEQIGQRSGCRKIDADAVEVNE